MEIRKVTQLGPCDAITIPKHFGLKRGSYVKIREESGNIIITPIEEGGG